MLHWQEINWQDDLRALLAVLGDEELSIIGRQALRESVGKHVLFMSEMLEPIEFAYALQVCKIDESMAWHYRRMYIRTVKKQLKNAENI